MMSPASVPHHSMGDFGNKFRAAREKKSLSLDDVSNVTKISSRMLQAIEEEHFDLLPGGVFNKGFIRAYAKHLGLDGEEAVTDYLACLRQAQVEAREVWEPAPVAPPKPAAAPAKTAVGKKTVPAKAAPVETSAPVQVEELPDLHLPRAEDVRPPRSDFSQNPGTGIPWSVVAAAVVVMILLTFLWIRHSHSSETRTVTPSVSASAPQSSPASIAPPAVTQAAASEPARNSTPPTNSPPQPSAASVTPPPKGSSPAPAAADNASDVTVRTFDKPASKASAKTAQPLTLVIRASETSWISVLADGQLVTQETLIAPAHTSVRASREIDVRIGNAAGISFVFNGKEIGGEGNEAEVKNYVFDESGMKSVPVP